MRKTLATISILWIIGFSIYFTIDFIGSGWSPDLDDWGALLLIVSPAIVILLFVSLSEFSQKQKLRSTDVDSDNTKTSRKQLEVPHKDESWIFLSYRRADSADISGRIYDRLIQEFGNHSVFKDVDSIPLGLDFRSVLNQALSQSRIFIAVIGPNWLGKLKGQPIRKIDESTDFVRIEVASALERGIPVIPLLVYGATMPQENELPEDLKSLAYRNGSLIRPDPDFNHDINRVISGINRLK